METPSQAGRSPRSDHVREIGSRPGEIDRSVGVDPENIAAGLGLADGYYGIGSRDVTLGLSGPNFSFDGGQAWLDWRDAKNN